MRSRSKPERYPVNWNPYKPITGLATDATPEEDIDYVKDYILHPDAPRSPTPENAIKIGARDLRPRPPDRQPGARDALLERHSNWRFSKIDLEGERRKTMTVWNRGKPAHFHGYAVY
jgi:hypothetical protein